jgi:hypothetical protein
MYKNEYIDNLLNNFPYLKDLEISYSESYISTQDKATCTKSSFDTIWDYSVDYTRHINKNCNHKFNPDCDKKSNVYPTICSLSTNKNKTKHLYNKKINPTEYLQKIQTNYYDLYNNVSDIFDLSTRENLCDCYAFAIYSDTYDINSRIVMYIYNMLISIINVEIELSDVVIRYYLDISFFETITKINQNNEIDMKIKNFINNAFRYLYDSPNSEIYIYLFDKKNDPNYHMAQYRILRFIPFIDPSVRIAISRDADCILNSVDFYNFKILQKFDQSTPTIIYNCNCTNIKLINSNFKLQQEQELVISLSGYIEYTSDKHLFNYWNDWINTYRSVFEKNTEDFYFANLYAGLIGFTLKFQPDFFKKTYHDVKKKYLSYNENKNISDCSKERFNNGFDEVFLYELAKKINTIPKPKYIGSFINTDFYNNKEFIFEYDNKIINMLNMIIPTTDDVYNIFPCTIKYENDLSIYTAKIINTFNKFNTECIHNIKNDKLLYPSNKFDMYHILNTPIYYLNISLFDKEIKYSNIILLEEKIFKIVELVIGYKYTDIVNKKIKYIIENDYIGFEFANINNAYTG